MSLLYRVVVLLPRGDSVVVRVGKPTISTLELIWGLIGDSGVYLICDVVIGMVAVR